MFHVEHNVLTLLWSHRVRICAWGWSSPGQSRPIIWPQATVLNNGSGKRYYYGPWVHSGRSAVSRYLGLKIQISGKTHYDWARVVVTGLVNAILTGYAYESPWKGDRNRSDQGCKRAPKPYDVSTGHTPVLTRTRSAKGRVLE